MYKPQKWLLVVLLFMNSRYAQWIHIACNRIKTPARPFPFCDSIRTTKTDEPNKSNWTITNSSNFIGNSLDQSTNVRIEFPFISKEMRASSVSWNYSISRNRTAAFADATEKWKRMRRQLFVNIEKWNRLQFETLWLNSSNIFSSVFPSHAQWNIVICDFTKNAFVSIACTQQWQHIVWLSSTTTMLCCAFVVSWINSMLSMLFNEICHFNWNDILSVNCRLCGFHRQTEIHFIHHFSVDSVVVYQFIKGICVQKEKSQFRFERKIWSLSGCAVCGVDKAIIEIHIRLSVAYGFNIYRNDIENFQWMDAQN